MRRAIRRPAGGRAEGVDVDVDGAENTSSSSSSCGGGAAVCASSIASRRRVRRACNAPCSASGIVRRHPDVRWLRRPDDIAALAQVQAELLNALWPLLAPGGRLVYATCSVFKAEGQAQLDAFLQRRPDASSVAVPGFTGHLLPLADNAASPSSLDGFFYALILKP